MSHSYDIPGIPMTADKLTVCMPVYNGSRYLAESIASVLTQSYTDFHLIISDDCSTDDSPAIIQRFRDPRISYIRNPQRLGLVGNFNNCVSLSTGEYICLWHQDDVMLPDNLRKKVELLDTHPTVGFVHSNMEWLNEFTQETRGHWADDSTRDYVVPGYFFFLRNLTQNAVVCPSMMIRAQCYAALGGYREELPYTCDYEFSLRLSLYYDVACIGEPLLRNRWHAGSETQNFLRRGEVLKQEDLARKIVLSVHGHRIPDYDLAVGIMAHAAAWSALRAAIRRLSLPRLSSRSFLEAWQYFFHALRRHPSFFAERECWWVLGRLLLGPLGLTLARKIKHSFVKQSLETVPTLQRRPK